MHELSICQGLMRQVERVAADNNARSVERILLRVGELSGVEPSLLQSAFEIARAGTVASEAELEIETGSVVVKCQECGASSAAKANRLLCQYCGEWRVNVVEGEELLLLSVDIETAQSAVEESRNV
jgi:hydrogenase nickel incorporation protein HypA/HybF